MKRVVTQCALNENGSLEQLIEKADKFMYEHKRTKRLVNRSGIDPRFDDQIAKNLLDLPVSAYG